MQDGAKQAEASEAAGRALVPVDVARFDRDEARVEDGFWRKVRRVAGHVPFVEDAVAAYYCARDRATPVEAKAVIVGALAYFVIPVDAIPDFLAALGFTDDATVFYIAYRTVGEYVTDRHRDKARAILARESIPTDRNPETGTM